MSRRPRATSACLSAALASALALTACSSSPGSGAGGGSSISTSPATTSAAAPTGAPVTAAMLGDLRSLDPCSLTDPTAFGAGVKATFGDPQSLDYCVLEVGSSPGASEVHVGEIVTAPSNSAPQLEQGRPGSTQCQDELSLGGGLALVAAAIPKDGPATPATCTIADAAAHAAADALAAGRAGHRSYPAHSFGPVDACTVLTKSIVKAALPGLAAQQPIPHPAAHQCEYGASGTSSTYAALILAAAYARFDGGPDSLTFTVAGHQVVLVPDQPDGRSGECVGYGPHIAFPSRSGQAAMEMAELHVALPAGATDAAACADVRALARTVFARLP